jgi:hypothetical protein
LDRIELKVGVERRIDGMGAGVPHHQQIAVRRRILGRHRRHVAGGTGTVLDNNGLLDTPRNLVRHEPHHDVGAAARRKRNDDGDRTRRIIVGACRQSYQRNRGGEEASQQTALAVQHQSHPQILRCAPTVAQAFSMPWQRLAAARRSSMTS